MLCVCAIINTMHRYQKGFTLIELLVVISIIGVLSSVALASLNSARTKSQESARQSDASQVIRGLELYYDSNGKYPASIATSDPFCGNVGYCLNTIITTYLEPSKFMPAAPQDPRYINTSQNYRYCGWTSTSGSAYVILRYSSKTNGFCHVVTPADQATTPCGGTGTGNWYTGYPAC